MNFKLALAAVAVIGAASTAQAADLAKKAPAAANYVKVCDAYGAGFFYIPGSETCLKIGGFVRAQYRMYGFKNDFPGHETWGWNHRSSNGISTFARGEIQLDARTNTELGLLRSYIEIDTTATSYYSGSAGVDLSKAFIQFGGLTAGRATSMFDFFTGATYEDTFGSATSDTTVNLLAYTFAFGNGVTATLSIEDPSTGRRNGGQYDAVKGTGIYGGVKTPDLVANVNVTQAWGSAQVMAALHEDYSALAATGTKYGFAVGAGATINLPMLGAADKLSAQVAYSKGATSYVGGADADFAFNAAVDGIDQATAWGVAAGLTHGWTKTLSSTVEGSYYHVDGAGVTGKEVDLQANLEWAPVTGLTIGGEVEYRKIDMDGKGPTDAVAGTLRIQRSF